MKDIKPLRKNDSEFFTPMKFSKISIEEIVFKDTGSTRKILTLLKRERKERRLSQ
jgi:hypothetical protein